MLFIVTNCFMKGVTINCGHPQSSDIQQQLPDIHENDDQQVEKFIQIPGELCLVQKYRKFVEAVVVNFIPLVDFS